MAATEVVYRLTVPASGSTFTPGQTADPASTDFWVTSSRDPADQNYIVAPPQDDGDSLDLLHATATDGAAQIEISDVDQGGGTSGSTASASDALTWPLSSWTAEGNPGLPSVGTGGTGPQGDAVINFSVGLLGGLGGLPATVNSYGRYARTFTGLTPSTTYQADVVCRQLNRTSEFMDAGNGIKAWVATTTEGGTTEAFGTEYNAYGAYGSNPQPWETVSVQFVTGASGSVLLTFGWVSATGLFLVTSIEFDSITITAVANPSLGVGRYVTRWLADTGARQQMLGRPAYLEYTTDDGATWNLIRYGFVTDIELPRAQSYLLTIGGARRRERNIPVGRLPDLVGVYQQFRPTCLFGTPVWDGLPGYITDFGRPLFQVTGISSPGDNGPWVALHIINGWFPINEPWFGGRSTFQIDPVQYINDLAESFYIDGPGAYIDASLMARRGRFRGLTAHVYSTAGVALTTCTLWGMSVGRRPGSALARLGRLIANDTILLSVDPTDISADVGDYFHVNIRPNEPSEAFPLWFQGHPAELIAYALQAIDLTWDVSAYSTARSVVGEDLCYTGCITDPKLSVGEFVESVGAVFGLAVVMGDVAGERKIVATRQRVRTTDAVTTIDDDDLRGFGGSPTFRLADASRRNVVRATVRQFIPWDPAITENSGPTRPPSTLLPFDAPYVVEYEPVSGSVDADTYGEQAIDLTLAGSPGVRLRNATSEPVPLQGHSFVDALASRLFDRHARGTPEYGLTLAGPIAAGSLGDVILDATSHLPNAQPARTPTAQRGGSRPMRIVQHTREPAGDVITAIDEGSGVPCTTSFTLTVDTADWTAAGEYALDITIHNCTALAAAGAHIDLYLALTADTSASPTDSGVLVASRRIDAADGDDQTDDIGFVPPGVVAWVRGEAWVPGGAPSTSTYWYSVNGPDTSSNPTAGPGGTPGSLPDPVTPPGPTGDISGLAFSLLEAFYFELTWTNTDTANPVRVRARVNGTTPWTFVMVLAPGSTTIRVTPTAQGTDYDVEVTLLDASSGITVGTTLTDTDTTDTVAGGGTLITLPTPTSPRAFSGIIPAGSFDGGAVGIAVVAEPVDTFPDNPYPYTITFEIAVETAVGSGVHGSWLSDEFNGFPVGGERMQAVVPRPTGDTTAYWTAPNDGKKRYFRARAWHSVYTPSAWTATVEATPYVNQPLTPPGGGMVEIYDLGADGVGATGPGGDTGSVTINASHEVKAWQFIGNSALRLRLYTSQAARDADTARVINTTYAPAEGLYYEVILPSGGSYTLTPSPYPLFGPATSGVVTIYYTLASLYPSGTTSDPYVQMQYTTT